MLAEDYSTELHPQPWYQMEIFPLTSKGDSASCESICQKQKHHISAVIKISLVIRELQIANPETYF